LKNPWIEWEPHPVTGKIGPTPKQWELLLSIVQEILYGGAVRGGKTWALMAALVMYADAPGHNGIIFRKSRDDLYLPDGPVDIAEDWGWEEKGASFDGRLHRYTFPSGKTITFGYMGEAGSQRYKRYKSSWFQDIFFDQVEEIQFKQYDWMRNRLGRLLVSRDVPLRYWSSANPDGFEWVYDYFVKPETRKPWTQFIPATADDNPWVDLDALEETLSKTSDPILYRQLRKGVWGLSTSGGMFDSTKFKLQQLLPVGDPIAGVRYWDLAATDEMEGGNPAYSAGVRMWRNLRTNLVYVDSVAHGRWGSMRVEDELAAYAAYDRALSTEYNLPMIVTHIEQEPGASGKALADHYIRMLSGYAVFADRVTGSKEDRAKPWSACVARGFAHLVQGGEEGSALWIEGFKHEHRRFPGGEFKDRVDASSGAYNKLFELQDRPRVKF